MLGNTRVRRLHNFGLKKNNNCREFEGVARDKRDEKSVRTMKTALYTIFKALQLKENNI